MKKVVQEAATNRDGTQSIENKLEIKNMKNDGNLPDEESKQQGQEDCNSNN